MRILLAGATGTIGLATAYRLRARGHDVICPMRGPAPALDGFDTRRCHVTDAADLRRALATDRVDALVSCLASRTGAPKDAWAIEHAAQIALLNAAQEAGAAQAVLLSAICVQKPRLAFQHAKLAFEAHLQDSGLPWTIVRSTAYFKSLSGQVARVQKGKPFLLFGDGTGTACKPISDRDLADYLVDCLETPARQGRILPIGGPGPAITPLDQGRKLYEMLGQTPRFRHVPLRLMDGIIGGLGALGRLSTGLADKAELARIGRYYASESMLLWDAAQNRYDAEATPETGSDSLWDHYAALIRGDARADLGAHAVF